MSDTPVWYYNFKGKAQGPMTFDQVKATVAKGDLRGHDLMFKEGGSEWKRASEWDELNVLFEDDKSTFTKFIKLPEEERTVIRTDNTVPEVKWVILVRIEEDKEIRFKQKGPFGTDEVKQFLREKKVTHTDHIWKKGAPKWMPISDVPDFHASQMDVTEELKQVMSEAVVRPTLPEVAEEKVIHHRAAPEKVTPKISVQEKTVEIEAPVKVQAVETPRPQMIPVIPHVVPTGGTLAANAAAKAPRVESFGATEAQVFAPVDEDTGLRRRVARLKEEEKEEEIQAAEPEDLEVTASGADLEDFEEVSKTEVEVQDQPTQVVASVSIPVESPKIPIKVEGRVEPRAEPRRPEIARAIHNDSEKARGWLNRLAPVMMILLFVSMGAGIWATLKTRSPIINADRPVPVQDPVKPVVNAPAPEAPKLEVKLGDTESIAEAEPTEEEIFDKEISEVSEETKSVALKKVTSPDPKKKYGAPVAKTVVKETKDTKENKENKEIKEVKEAKPVVAQAGIDLPNISSAPKNATLKVNNKVGYFEVIGGFRKGELLEIKIDGESGEILDLPALHQRLEVRALKNFVHRISLNDLRIPKGTYQFSVKWSASRSSRKLTWGAEKAQLQAALIMHKKQIAFDLQQEKKKILKALKEFSVVLVKAEQEASKGNLKAIQKDLLEKMPAEIKIVRLSRHELIFSSHWEKMANQWDRLQTMVKEGGRGPASVTEISKAKKAMTILEQNIKDKSIFEN